MKTVRNLCRVLCILAVLVSFTNCQNDTATEIQQEETLQKEFPYRSTLLTKQDIEYNSKLSNQMRSLRTLQSSSAAKSTYNDTYGFTIDTDVIKLIESTESNSHSYTFPIERENYTGSELENLVFVYDATIDDYTASLVKYHFSASQKQQFIEMNHVGTAYDISYEPISIDLSQVINKNSASVPCTTIYTTYHITPDTEETFPHSTNGQVTNECQHEDEEGISQCETYTVIEIDCPDGGGTSYDVSTPNPTNNTNNTTSGGGGNQNDGNTTPNDTNDNYHDIVTSPITKDELQEITNELNNILGDGNWDFEDDTNENLPSFDNPEDLQEFINGLIEGNFHLESSEMELNSIRTDTHRLTVSDFFGIDIVCVVKVKLPTEENGLEEMKILSVNSYLDGSSTISSWTQLSTQDTTDELSGPNVSHYVSGNQNKQRVSVLGNFKLGIIYRDNVIGSDKILKIVISYITGNINQIDPVWSYWEYAN